MINVQDLYAKQFFVVVAVVIIVAIILINMCIVAVIIIPNTTVNTFMRYCSYCYHNYNPFYGYCYFVAFIPVIINTNTVIIIFIIALLCPSLDCYNFCIIRSTVLIL